jgi:hypothetical protein
MHKEGDMIVSVPGEMRPLDIIDINHRLGANLKERKRGGKTDERLR